MLGTLLASKDPLMSTSPVGAANTRWCFHHQPYWPSLATDPVKFASISGQLCSYWHQIGQTSPACPSEIQVYRVMYSPLTPSPTTPPQLNSREENKEFTIYQVYFTLLSCLIESILSQINHPQDWQATAESALTRSLQIKRKHSYTGGYRFCLFISGDLFQ